MKRCALGAAAVALLLAISGCGNAGGVGATAQPAVLPQAVQYQLGVMIQKRLRARLGNRAIRSDSIRCRRGHGAFACRLKMSEGPRRVRVELSVTIDTNTHAVQATFTRATDRHWLTELQR